ncbi:DNA-directed RNA polymerase subunit A' [Candidatus Woesearchaeota archaeon]|nr:DNA-directed RNA polymerase subunit A' [Candidatus Woesearchaeota archaeon]
MVEVHKKIDGIVFRIFSPKQTVDSAAVKIITPELYDKEGYPVDGGLIDTRLGVIDPGLRCKTCGGKLKECSGHFGYIELARPIVHIKFVKQILDLLRSTCKFCNRILIPEEHIGKYVSMLQKVGDEEGFEARRKKIKTIVNKYKLKEKCPHCDKKQGKIKIEKPYSFYEDDVRLSPIEVRVRLEKIEDDDLEIFGFNPAMLRPEWMILTVLTIPPVTMRPSITLESGERSEDDLTHKLGDVVRINQRLFENINAGAPEVIIEDLWDLLQYHVTTYFDNEISQIPPARHRGGQILKTLTNRIKSKEGRIRHNLAGKRTNFSARTVISPDPMLSVNEVGVPMKMATNLTVPKRVTEWNIVYLKKFVENGPKKYPGANYIIRPDGKRKAITDETKEEILEEFDTGFVVERHLMDGDIALFNRQPSLHRMSMMCHKIKVLPGKTLRLNPLVCAPYNADFDGDEMNLHIPQTEEARAEAEILMLVQTQIISPRYGLSIVGCIQDAITGNFLITGEESIPREEAIDLLYLAGVDDFSKLPDKKIISGRELFSVLLPKDFNFTGKDKSGDAVKIVNGELKSGLMDKANLGQESGLMLRNIYEQYGPEFTADLLGKISKLGINTLLKKGFSVGIGDVDLMAETKKEIENVVVVAEEKIDALIKESKEGTLELLPGLNMQETLELRIMEVLNNIRNEAGDIAMKEAKESGVLTMAKSGARGNILNISQMTAVVGQQSLRGKRIEKGFKGRTLSYFKRGDLSSGARGFIKNNFKSGLLPHEFFFGAMLGRDSLMDTALRTPKSGYLYRRLSNAMQDLKVEYDSTVREANKKIVQFSFGEDGLDVSKTEGGVINVKKIIEKVK